MPQVVISIILLKSRQPSQIIILKASLVGAIVSNLHLLLGLGFLFGGLGRWEQKFNNATAATCGMLLLLATMGLMVPTISSLRSDLPNYRIAQLSRGTAVTLLLSYILFIIFRMISHKEWFRLPSEKSIPRRRIGLIGEEEGDIFRAMVHVGGVSAASSGGLVTQNLPFREPDEEPDVPTLSVKGGLATLVIFTTLLAFHTEFTTNNLTAITGHLSSSFIGMVLLPLFAIDPGCVSTSRKDKQDANVDNTLGKCIQTALVVTPLMVILAWIIGVQEMTLLFNDFEVGTLFLSVIIVNYITSNGKSNW